MEQRCENTIAPLSKKGGRFPRKTIAGKSSPGRMQIYKAIQRFRPARFISPGVVLPMLAKLQEEEDYSVIAARHRHSRSGIRLGPAGCRDAWAEGINNGGLRGVLWKKAPRQRIGTAGSNIGRIRPNKGVGENRWDGAREAISRPRPWQGSPGEARAISR
jgi:hypothetical protein